MRAFWAAVSRVNGGKGGRDMVTSCLAIMMRACIAFAEADRDHDR
jgi:hypothetical protein